MANHIHVAAAAATEVFDRGEGWFVCAPGGPVDLADKPVLALCTGHGLQVAGSGVRGHQPPAQLEQLGGTSFGPFLGTNSCNASEPGERDGHPGEPGHSIVSSRFHIQISLCFRFCFVLRVFRVTYSYADVE